MPTIEEVDRRLPDGRTPLMLAAGLGQADVAEQLIADGADVHLLEPHFGATALHKAAQDGSPVVITLLLDAGAFVDQQSPVLGNTALIDAVLHKREEAVGVLLERGARTGIRNHWNQTALELAHSDRLDAIAGLIEARDRADADRIAGQPLFAAAKAGDVAAIERLAAAGAPVNDRSPIIGDPDDDYTPVGIATREGHVAAVRALLAAGADPLALSGLMGGTAVHEASYFGNAAILRLFLDHIGDDDRIDAQGAYNGLTAVHDAVWHGHAEAALMLANAGARLDLVSHTGHAPEALARLYGYDDLAAALAAAQQG